MEEYQMERWYIYWFFLLFYLMENFYKGRKEMKKEEIDDNE